MYRQKFFGHKCVHKYVALREYNNCHLNYESDDI